MLGIRRGWPYEPRERHLDPGDRLVLYSDGVVEHRGRTRHNAQALTARPSAQQWCRWLRAILRPLNRKEGHEAPLLVLHCACLERVLEPQVHDSSTNVMTCSIIVTRAINPAAIVEAGGQESTLSYAGRIGPVRRRWILIQDII